jgi:hypothetical protein
MVKYILIFVIAICGASVSSAQELQARVSINSSLVSSQVDKKIFQTLQTALHNFLNNRKWTNDVFQPSEKIACNFLMNITKADNNVFSAELMVQAARPVYNSTYQTPLVNFQDEGLIFKYVEYQTIEFNENRVAGTDGLVSNLPATLAYYVYIILGLDYSSFSLRGGDAFFSKAQNIVNNAPEGRDIIGWKAFDGLRNRYWLMENFTNSRYAQVHEAIYGYYRLGMDFMYENEAEARQAILTAINLFNTVNNDIPNSMIVQFFFQGKSNELIRVFKKAPPEEKQRVQEMLMRIDIANANAYKQELR